MASINDVNNSINKVNTTLWTLNASLQTVNTSVESGVTATNNVQASVNTLDGDVKAGFTQTVDGLKTLEVIDLAIAQILYHLTQQTDTMICALQQISQNTCGILTQVTIQTALQERLAKDVGKLLAIAETVSPAAALDVERLEELKAKVEKCCPPAPPKPACTYTACPAPKPLPMPKLPAGTNVDVK